MTTTLQRHTTHPHEAREFSDWHERCIEHLLIESGSEVQREPLIRGKTPDLLVTPPQGKPIVIECIARLQDPSHAISEQSWHLCGGSIKELHQNVYSRLDEKATKYREIAEDLPYVIALYDATCANSLDGALDMMMSPYAPTVSRAPNGRITGKHYNTLWPTQNIPVALFELYPHLSGFIYSRWPREHYYLPNPYTSSPISPNPFTFAQVPQLPKNYMLPAWQPSPAMQIDDYEEPPKTWQLQMQRLNEALDLQNKVAV